MFLFFVLVCLTRSDQSVQLPSGIRSHTELVLVSVQAYHTCCSKQYCLEDTNILSRAHRASRIIVRRLETSQLSPHLGLQFQGVAGGDIT